MKTEKEIIEILHGNLKKIGMQAKQDKLIDPKITLRQIADLAEAGLLVISEYESAVFQKNKKA